MTKSSERHTSAISKETSEDALCVATANTIDSSLRKHRESVRGNRMARFS